MILKRKLEILDYESGNGEEMEELYAMSYENYIISKKDYARKTRGIKATVRGASFLTEDLQKSPSSSKVKRVALIRWR